MAQRRICGRIRNLQESSDLVVRYRSSAGTGGRLAQPLPPCLHICVRWPSSRWQPDCVNATCRICGGTNSTCSVSVRRRHMA
jgi:hypothetical protein